MLAKRPPMGWNSWNTFGAKIDENMIREMADRMVDDGYLACGYEYLVIDDCWALRERDENGRLVPDPAKFPSGMKALADYVHAKGLKFGMYSCAGIETCAGYPSSFGHEFVDAETFADWGVDFLKYDFCNFPKSADARTAYSTMAVALKATGREILFSACNWGCCDVHHWARAVGCHMFRSTGDINDSYASFREIGLSQMKLLDTSAVGCYNDPDMLIVGMNGAGNVGMGGCNEIEYRAHFAMWCLYGVPLIMGCDLRVIEPKYRELLQNKLLLRIDQDEESRPPMVVYEQWDMYALVRHLSNGEYAIGFFNMSDELRDKPWNTPIAVFSDFGLPVYSGYDLEVTDVFTGETRVVSDRLRPDGLQPHEAKLYLCRPVKH